MSLATVDDTATTPGRAYRWGVAMARHRRLVIGVWLVVVVACGAAYPALNSSLLAPDYSTDNSDSMRANQLVREHFPQLGDEQGVVVFDSTGPSAQSVEFRSLVTDVLAEVRQADGIAGVLGPFDGNPGQISDDQRTAFAMLAYDGNPAEVADRAEAVQKLARAASTDSIDVAVTGYSPLQSTAMEVQTTDMERAEGVGIPVALLVLLFALGAAVAASVPIGIGVAGILFAVGALFTMSTVSSVNALVMSMATMIGLGIGIDYAMFVVSRFREELAKTGATSRDQREQIAHAVGTAMRTAGMNIVASGLVVAIALCSLAIVRATVFRAIALGVATSVLCTLAVALTLLPATLAALGPAVNRGALPSRFRPADAADADGREGSWARWARLVMRKPLLFGGTGVAALAIAAAPIGSITHGMDIGIGLMADTPAGHAAQVLDAKFAPGLMSPIEIAATGPDGGPLSAAGDAQTDALATQLRSDARVASVLVQRADGRALVVAIPTTAFDSPTSEQLVRDIRAQAERADAAQILVGGTTAEFVDISDEITDRLPWVIAFVLIFSLVFLIFVFRSVLLPIKAILMNLLATGAALGITVAVFQWGYGESVLDFHSVGTVQVYLPTMVFVVLFGLSMDYEVFLIGRMREAWERTRDNATAVAEGIEHTGRPITAAAAIMVVVFGAFVSANMLELKQIGFALAVAVAIDAVLVRMVLVPAFMRLFGDWNWWLPSLRARATT